MLSALTRHHQQHIMLNGCKLQMIKATSTGTIIILACLNMKTPTSDLGFEDRLFTDFHTFVQTA